MHSMKMVISFYLTVAAVLVYGQTVTSPPDMRLMRQIYVQDQRDRGVLLPDDGKTINSESAPAPLDYQALEKRDAERRRRTIALLRAGQLTTAQDFHDAAFIFQHGSTADDYLLAHLLAVEAIVRGDLSSKWISAATLDRYLMAIGRPQAFGTQYVGHGGNDADITQKPYDAGLIPDAMRLDFCVPPLAEQKLNLKEFQTGKYPAGILPPGCTR